MSQIPVKAQQAIGIGSLLNKLGNVIFSPAGAAEFEMTFLQCYQTMNLYLQLML
jgi:hypothetical protein